MPAIRREPGLWAVPAGELIPGDEVIIGDPLSSPNCARTIARVEYEGPCYVTIICTDGYERNLDRSNSLFLPTPAALATHCEPKGSPK